MIQIRLYKPGDLKAVREICCETGDRGESVDQLVSDREMFADLVMSYYTTYEPEALWVAEYEGRVVGYLTGCLDSRRYARFMKWRIVPAAVCRAIGRGALYSRQAWRWLGAWWRTCRLQERQRKISLRDYPAHVHVNILGEFRGRRMGSLLAERFLEQVRSTGVSGVYAAVRSDNRLSCRFFERMGFSEISRAPVAYPDGPAYQRHDTIVYGTRV